MATIPQILEEISDRHETLANPMRILILSVIVANGSASWTEISNQLEKVLGRDVNPNSVSFHLKRLTDSGLIVASGSTYKPSQEASGVGKELAELINAIKAK